MPRYKIIVNPVSGRGSGEKYYPIIQARLKEMGLDFDMVRTEEPGHARQLAAAAKLEGYDVVVAVGGDGTVNEVLNGLAASRQNGNGVPALGLICVGRGNDFGFGIGAQVPVEAACRALTSGQRKRIDIGFVRGGDYPSGRCFVNGVGIGFDAVVGFEALKLKRLTGFASYIVAALRTMFLFFNAPTVRIQLDHQTITQPALMVSIMNGRRMGGGFLMAPHGDPSDGELNICLVGQLSRMGILLLIPKFMNGTQAAHPAVQMLHTRRISVTAVKGTLPAHSDGETLCTAGDHLEMEIWPGMVEVIVPVEGVQA